MDPCGQNRGAESELRREASRLRNKRGQVRPRGGVVHRRKQSMTRVIASAGSFCVRNERVAMVLNLLLSQTDKISPAAVAATEGEADSTEGSTFGGQKGECSVLSVSLELELRMLREQNASLTAAVNKYNVGVENLEKMMNKEEQNGMVLERKLKWSKPEVEWLETKNKLLQKTRGGMLYSAVWDTRTSSRNVERLLEAL